MSIQNKLRNLKDKKSYSSPAKRTMEHLKPILSKSNELRKRWMWELLQNASDLGDEINTEFEITDTELIFRHNGKPFGLDEAFNLIMPDSSKDEESLHSKEQENPPIGQFGTGFISTHILSKRIRINGIVEDSEEDEYFSFSFELDRSERKNKDFLIQSIKDSEKEYGGSLSKISNYDPSEFDTEFVYYLKDTYSSIDSIETINEGLSTLHELLPFVFAFRPQLKSVSVKDFRNQKSIIKLYKRKTIESEIEEIELIKTTCMLNDVNHFTATVATVVDRNTTIAIKVKQNDDGSYIIQKFPDYSPILYCAFPMIGATEFNFPVIVHSEYFTPNRERDGIEISEYDKENRDILIDAKDAFLTLIGVVEEQKWDCSYHLFGLTKVDFANDDIQKWYKQYIFKPIYNKLRGSNIIRTSDEIGDDFNSLSELYIPHIDKRKSDKYELLEKLFSLGKNLFADELPIKTQYKKWFKKIDFEVFDEKKFDLEKLIEKISEDNKTLTDFQENHELNEEATVQYLISVIEFVFDREEENLLNDFAIIPNQNGELCLQKKLDLDFINHKSLTDKFDEKIKIIGADLTKVDCRETLLKKDFEKISNLIDSDDKYELSDLCQSIDDELRSYAGSFNDDEFLLILKELFHWHTNCGLSDETLTKLFPYFSLNKSQLYLNTKTPEELEYAFDIEISGKSKVLAKIAKSSLTEEELTIVAENTELVSSFINWLNDKKEDSPDEELGDIGEEFLNFQLCQIFGENRVLWEDKSEYDFRILEKDLIKTKYYIDAKTTGKGIANTENVPFYMRTAQWHFLDKEQAFDKYVIARVYKNGNGFDVKYVKINLTIMK
jgi:hypothetical protein